MWARAGATDQTGRTVPPRAHRTLWMNVAQSGLMAPAAWTGQAMVISGVTSTANMSAQP